MFRLSAVIIILWGLSACNPPSKVAVVERATVNRSVEIDKIGGNLIRIVQPGDTLYSLAFAAGLDAKQIAAWNGVSDTTKLNVGQRIRLTRPKNFIDPKTQNSNTVAVNRADNKQVKSVVIPSTKTIRNTQTSNSTKASQPSRSQKLFWQWPLRGKVIRGFSQSTGQQGIDIKASAGLAVIASNAGEVVYVGNGLKGYGNLIIVKHNDTYLSAYAHNKEIFVREGQRVKTQQKIGSVGTNRHKETALHFQIRKNGQPVNPLSYLPKSG